MIDAPTLRRWQQDVCEFASVLWTLNPATGRVEPLKLEPHQKEFLTAATARGDDGRFVHRTCVASWPRREGKTMCAAVLGVWRLVCHGPGQRALVLANSREQAASNVFDAIERLFRDTPTFDGLVPEECFRKDAITVPALDNEVVCLPCAWRSVQGRRCDLLLSDELHAAQDTRAFDFAARQSEGADAQVVLSTQAGEPDDSNPVWRLWNARSEPHIYFSLLNEHRTEWGKALAERDRAEMLPLSWSYQHRNEWSSREDSLLDPSDVDACCVPGQLPMTTEEFRALTSIHGGLLLGAGLDRSMGVGRDSTALLLVGKDMRHSVARTKVRVVAMARFDRHTQDDIIGTLREWTGVYGVPYYFLAEAYQSKDVGDAAVGLCPTELVTPSGPRQTAAFTALARLVREHRILIPREGELSGSLVAELKRMRYEQRGGGTLSFSGKQGKGKSDDAVYALLWACEALTKVPTFGGLMSDAVTEAHDKALQDNTPEAWAAADLAYRQEREAQKTAARFAEYMTGGEDLYV